MTRWIKKLFIVGLFFSLQAIAEDYSEQSLRTLFTSQQQRQDIEGDRRGSNLSQEQVQVGPSSVQVNGMVKRRNGKSVVWVNGKNTMDNSMVDGVKVYSNSISTQNKVPVMIDGRKVYLKPGQTWSEKTGISDVNN
ncbi:MAG: hypothetical protein KAS57_05700 [Gammaproteobacteria bacterium]|nr:hypothetical protein [Gammaproteobacteria bacterium]